MKEIESRETRRVRNMLPEDRWAHTKRVVDTAGELAEQYNLPPEPLRRAALLHDIGKGLSWGEQQRRARDYRGDLDPIEEQLSSLWHGPAGAHFCRTDLRPEPPEQVLFAVAEHSTGHPDADFTLLALLVADFTEPGREFQASIDLRQDIGELPLEVLARKTLEFKLENCLRRQSLIHPRSVEAYNQLCA